MNTPTRLLLALMAAGLIQNSFGDIIVNDTWIDNTRNDPTPANNYSENGVDLDLDGNIESAWFKGPSAFPVTMVNPSPGTTPGIIRGAIPASGSASLTTYFTPTASPVTLTTPGQQFKLTWAFTPSGVGASAGQGLRLGIVDWPEATATPVPRLTSDVAPSSGNLAIFPGYSMWLNINTVLGNSNPFQLMERSVTGSTFLANTAGWTFLDDEETSGATGYVDGTEYTFTFMATLNGLGELELESSMTGGSLGGDGSLNVSFTDPTPNTLTFDAFGVRFGALVDTASQFDTSLFKVELIPEPSVVALGVLGALGLIALGRRSLR